jgi:hypothetical protein
MLWLMLSATQPSSAEVAIAYSQPASQQAKPSSAEVAIAYIRPAASVISFALAGNTTCDSKFAFGVPSADECIYDSGLQISLCWHFWEDHGGDDAHVRRCSTAADCPLRFAAVQCSLQPSGGPAQRPPNARSPRDGRVSCCRCMWFFFMRMACTCALRAFVRAKLCAPACCAHTCCAIACGFAGLVRCVRCVPFVCARSRVEGGAGRWAGGPVIAFSCPSVNCS